jgi:hypothetical protein
MLEHSHIHNCSPQLNLIFVWPDQYHFFDLINNFGCFWLLKSSSQGIKTTFSNKSEFAHISDCRKWWQMIKVIFISVMVKPTRPSKFQIMHYWYTRDETETDEKHLLDMITYLKNSINQSIKQSNNQHECSRESVPKCDTHVTRYQ